jgi:hypothetical protein
LSNFHLSNHSIRGEDGKIPISTLLLVIHFETYFPKATGKHLENKWRFWITQFQEVVPTAQMITIQISRIKGTKPDK